MNGVGIICCLLVMCVTRASSVIVATRDVQRKAVGDSCTIQWNVTETFTTYAIKQSGSTTLGSNTYSSFNSNNRLATLVIWNIQTNNAGYYSLSITTGQITEVSSLAVLFVYDSPQTNTIVAVGRNPSFDGDQIELNCSAYSRSQPANYQPRLYYFWNNGWYGNFRNISSGPAMLLNGDVLPRYSIKNDGRTLVIASAEYRDNSFQCSVKEEWSPSNSQNDGPNLQINSRPFTYDSDPSSKKVNSALHSQASYAFYFQTNPTVGLSFSNWNFVNASGDTAEYTASPISSNRVSFSISIDSTSSYGNYSITLTNIYGSRIETFQVLPLDLPETPSEFSAQYLTDSLVSLQWRCGWANGADQSVFVRLTDVAEEVEVQAVFLGKGCYNSKFFTLFQNNIQPETDYEASIWSVSSLGSSDAVKLSIRTPKRLIFHTSPANISVMGTQAVIGFSIADSTVATLWLNITCCVELTAQCNNQSYSIASTDTQLTYDILPTGSDYVFDFIVYNTDSFTYTYTLAILKGVRVSTTEAYIHVEPKECSQCAVAKGETLINAVIVLAVLLGVAVFALIGCIIGFLVYRCRQGNSRQQRAPARIPRSARSKANAGETSHYDSPDDVYSEAVIDVDQSKDNTYYKSLESSDATVGKGEYQNSHERT